MFNYDKPMREILVNCEILVPLLKFHVKYWFVTKIPQFDIFVKY